LCEESETRSLCQRLLRSASLYKALFRIDEEIAAEARRSSCPRCGGRLHWANYSRKPRGADLDLGEDYAQRFSLCCGTEGCRRRATPPSVRYLSRRVYLGVVVVLVTAMMHGVTARRAAQLSAELEVSRRTIERWRCWWSEEFPSSSTWKALRGRFVPTPKRERMPASLIERLDGDEYERVVRLLRLLSPLTTTSWPSTS